jgi:hypothetical protein
MTLPPWRSDKLDDQRALSRFIISELDRADEMRSRSATDGDLQFLRTVIELDQQAKRVGLSVNLPKATSDGDLPDFERAARDVPRIRALFRLHWRKRNRTMPPSAEQIAAERWELSRADTAKLIDKFQRKTAVSQR